MRKKKEKKKKMMMKKNFTQKWAFIRLLYAFSVESTFA